MMFFVKKGFLVDDFKKIGRLKGIPCSKETKEKISASIKEKWKQQKAIEKQSEVL